MTPITRTNGGKTIKTNIKILFFLPAVFFLVGTLSPPLGAQPPLQPTEVPADVLQKYGSEAAASQGVTPPPAASQNLGKWHLRVIHFPIALTLVAALAELIFLLGGKPDYRTVSRFLNTLAALSAVASIATGWLAAQSVLTSGRLMPILPLHRNLGFISAILLVLNALLMETGLLKSEVGQWIYRLGLLAACGLVAWTGYEGGLMVFGED